VVVVDEFCQLFCGYFLDRHRTSFLDESVSRLPLAPIREQATIKPFSRRAIK
jgi:hypothetical protein